MLAVVFLFEIMFEEYLGKKYGNLTITKFDSYKKNGTPVFAVTCDCGNTYLKTGIDRLELGKTKDCGCSKRNANLTNKKFGRLLVLEKTDIRAKRHIVWKCKCECGNEVYVSTHDLIEKKSCGCIMRDKQHFATHRPIHRVWNTMIERCYNSNKNQFYLYGGRGIKVCNEWLGNNPKGFSNFYDWAIKNGYKEEVLPSGRNKWTLDRIDPDKNYCPENCRWITNKEQQQNKRADKQFSYKGETKNIKQWLKQYFVKCQDYYSLLRMGYDNKFILDFISSVDKGMLIVIYNTPKGTIVNDVLTEYLSTLKTA